MIGVFTVMLIFWKPVGRFKIMQILFALQIANQKEKKLIKLIEIRSILII